ncbi:HBL/NHE enterotoxin family protein [Streptomyces sp. KLMMK]|uniref:HBL/NHE enterotoxin family protein n=1 Tax=Streptomyces sp. KLMMK TaxID=3109353 RepID=UPI002FFDF631
MTATTPLFPAVRRTAQDILDTQLGDTSGFPELSAHVEKLQGHARTWLDSTQHTVEEQLRTVQAFTTQYVGDTAPRLTELASLARADFVALLQSTKTALEDRRHDLVSAHDAVSNLDQALTADVSAFNEDMNAVSAKIASDQGLQEQLGKDLATQLARLKALQYAATHLMVLASGNDFSSLMSQSFTLAAEECYLHQLIKCLAALKQSVCEAETALRALGTGLDETCGIIDNVATSVNKTATVSKAFVTARLNATVKNVNDLAGHLCQLLDEEAHQ